MVDITNQKEFSKEYTYMYWAKRGLDRKRGRKGPTPNSFYVKYTHHMFYGEEALPLFTHFDSAVQLAGYIKYVVLGEIVMGLLSEEQVLDFFRNRTTLFSVADIDESLKQATTNLTLDELKAPTDIPHKRIYDRVLGMCVPVMFNGVNFRKEEAAAKMEAAKKLFGMEDKK